MCSHRASSCQEDDVIQAANAAPGLTAALDEKQWSGQDRCFAWKGALFGALGRPTLGQGTKWLVLANSERLGSEGGSPKQPHKVKERSHR
jgi:hypothetical protein